MTREQAKVVCQRCRGSLIGVAVAVMMTGGCSVGVQSRIETGHWSERAEHFTQTQQVHLDLTDPLTRQEAGIPEKRNSVIIERSGGDHMLDVELRLPEGKVLDVPAIGVVFSAPPAAPEGTQPQTIVVNRVASTAEEVRQALLAAAEKFGFDKDAMLEFAHDVAIARRGDGYRFMNRAFNPAQKIGYLWLSISARYDGEDRIQINYDLTWGEYGHRVYEQDLPPLPSDGPTSHHGNRGTSDELHTRGP